MDFEFSEEQLAFVKEVETFLDANDDPDVFDLTRENMAQIVDTPKRRAFMASLGRAGLAGHDLAQGVRGLRGRGRLRVPPQRAAGRAGRSADRQGRGHRRQDDHPPRQRAVEGRVPSQDPAQRGRVRRRLLRAQRRLRRRLHATQGHPCRRRLDPQRPEDVDHVRALRRVVLGGRAHRPRLQARRHHALPRPHRPARHHGQRHLDHGRRAHQRGLPRGRLRARRLRRGPGGAGVPVHLRGARPRALHHVHLLAHQPALRAAGRVREDDRARRQAPEGRPGHPPAAGPAGHPARGGPGHGAQVRLRVLEGRRRADGRGVRVQALRHRALQASGQRLHGHRRTRAASCA